jgi:hypothetical protein
MPNSGEGERTYKSRAVRQLDAFFSATDEGALRSNYRYAEELLADPSLPTLPDVTDKAARKMALPPGDEKHFRDHWFTIGGKDVEQEMRRGYKEAIRRATADDLLPIETFWVTGPGIGKFELLVDADNSRVTVHVRIPPALADAARRP